MQEALKRKPKYARSWLNLGISQANLTRYEQVTLMHDVATRCVSYYACHVAPCQLFRCAYDANSNHYIQYTTVCDRLQHAV